jgi:N6-adenosine-specific RNA methylase IME4
MDGAARSAEAATVTNRYRTIVADPPWPYEERNAHWFRRDDGHLLPYPTMAVDQIRALPVFDLTMPDISGTTAKRTGQPHDGSVLYLWTTTRFLRDAHDIAQTWGFTPTTVLVWCKPPRGFNVGGTFASNVEFILHGRKGTPKPATDQVDTRWFTWPRGAHSVKPDAFLDMVERVHPGPYLEMFARRQRLGWDTWGEEALQHVEMSA